jgi:tetratricopeptide (TPR) repeat protein
MDKQGSVLLSSAKFADALALFSNNLATNPQDPPTLVGVAQAQIGLGRLVEAISACQKALEQDPSLLLAHGTLCSAYQRLGRFEEANACSRNAISLQPEHFKPYVEIVRCSRIGQADAAVVSKLTEMAEDKLRPEQEKFHIHWALGKANDDLGNYELAIQHFDAASKVARNLEASYLNYNAKARTGELEFIKRSFPAGLFEESQPGDSSHAPMHPGPVLIVGMIRSGTTLLDTMLARYPGIASAGELQFWEHTAHRIFQENAGHDITLEAYQGHSKRYSRLLERSQPSAEWVIDKMPNNYRHLGLIHLNLPKAKIIHLKRHPIDTCLSIYMTDFGPRPPQFAFNRPNIVHAYQAYETLMNHWRDVLPAPSFLEVNYEDLVTNPEETLQTVCEYLELPWRPELLGNTPSPQLDNAQDIQTPSRWQARQPIYKSSLERWRCYQPWLGAFAQLMPAQ